MSVSRSSSASGAPTWSAWLNLPNGHCVTSFYPENSKADAETFARKLRQGVGMIQNGVRRKR